MPATAERQRLALDAARKANPKRWGPYLPERQWATVREDYSADGDVWQSFPHDHARSRAYRWGEDGLLGWCDRECRLCLAPALWNGHDAILKERLFGLGGPEGNHGEDVKELYFYLDATPTSVYSRALYKYPHAAFPYAQLVEANARRDLKEREFELADAGVLDDAFDLTVEYAKASDDDTLVRYTVRNDGRARGALHLLAQAWFRNTWSWGKQPEDTDERPNARRRAGGLDLTHATLGAFRLDARERPEEVLFCDNETNVERLYGGKLAGSCKDAFHDALIAGERGHLRDDGQGTKAAFHYALELDAGEERAFCFRLRKSDAQGEPFADFDQTFARCRAEADAFYDDVLAPLGDDPERRRVARQAYAGLLWTRQFYFYDVERWLEGDAPHQPAPPSSRKRAGARNVAWPHVFNRDVISVPDKWEYPWYAAWDLAFHMLPMARLDPDFAKSQLLVLLREWYMHPSGALPAYEFAFADANPPVHAWAVWRVYKMTGPRGGRDAAFLERAFHKLLLNFTWWVNRTAAPESDQGCSADAAAAHIFGGGFLGLDNVGLFDRGQLADGAALAQADGTAWVGFFCLTMLAIALELAEHNAAYEDVASKFFEHFVAITGAMNTAGGGTGLWDEADGFYYDQLRTRAGRTLPLKARSIVGLVPLFGTFTLRDDQLQKLTGFKKRMAWFLKNEPDLAQHVVRGRVRGEGAAGDGDGCGEGHLLSLVPPDRLPRVLARVFDENEFLSPFGVRSLSKVYGAQPYSVEVDGRTFCIDYAPGEGTTRMFGGNSNWRGPMWFPLSFMVAEALERYGYFFGDELRVALPGRGAASLNDAALELHARMAALFLPRAGDGLRPALADDAPFARDGWRDLVLFHEHFHGDTGRGLGASHQTGWTALVTTCLERLGKAKT